MEVSRGVYQVLSENSGSKGRTTHPLLSIIDPSKRLTGKNPDHFGCYWDYSGARGATPGLHVTPSTTILIPIKDTTTFEGVPLRSKDVPFWLTHPKLPTVGEVPSTLRNHFRTSTRQDLSTVPTKHSPTSKTHVSMMGLLTNERTDCVPSKGVLVVWTGTRTGKQGNPVNTLLNITMTPSTGLDPRVTCPGLPVPTISINLSHRRGSKQVSLGLSSVCVRRETYCSFLFLHSIFLFMNRSTIIKNFYYTGEVEFSCPM